MPVVYAERAELRQYQAPLLSLPWLCAAVLGVGVVIASFFIVLLPGGLWVKEAVYWEQPLVTFTRQLLVQLEGVQQTTAAEAQPLQLLWSSWPRVNDLLLSLAASSTANSSEPAPLVVRVPQVKTSASDSNLDGLADEIVISVRMPLLPGERVLHVTLLAFFEYRLRDANSNSNNNGRGRGAPINSDNDNGDAGLLAMNLSALAWHQGGGSGVPGARLSLDGWLRLEQRLPLGVHSGPRTVYAEPVLRGDNITYAADLRLDRLVQRYNDRNETVRYDVANALWTPGSNGEFVVEARLRVPPSQPVRYRPGAAQVVKLAWVQFWTVVQPLWIILFGFVFAYVLRHQIIETRVIQPVNNR